jgi:hypothetical protein
MKPKKRTKKTTVYIIGLCVVLLCCVVVFQSGAIGKLDERYGIIEGVGSVSDSIVKIANDYDFRSDSLLYIGDSGETHNLRIVLVDINVRDVIGHYHAPEGAKYIIVKLNVTNIGKKKTHSYTVRNFSKKYYFGDQLYEYEVRTEC